MSTVKKRIFGLDLIRAIATVLVIASHGALLFSESNNIITDALQLTGVLGVEMFYVLSGFLIGGILLNLLKEKEFTFATVRYFWIRRWFRTLPLYFLVLLINVIKVLLSPYSLPDGFWKYFFFLQNFKEKQSYFFPESWSLTVEEYAYVLAPLLIFSWCFLIKNKTKAFLYASFTAIIVFVVTKLVYYFNHINVYEDLIIWNASLKGVLIYRLDSIFYGFLAAYVFKKHAVFFREKRYYIFAIGVMLFFVVYGIMIASKFQINGFKLYWNVLYLPLNSVVIACCLPMLYYFPKPISWLKKLTEKISIYSYSIYLLHYTLVLSIMIKVLPVSSFSLTQKTVCAVLYVLLSYFFASFMYRYFEKPMTDLRDSPFFKRK